MKQYLAQIDSAKRIRGASSLHGVHCDREFAAILNRERDRADRTGQEFSMVVFDVGAENGGSAAARYLVPILTHRIRSTDELGWLEDGRIGAVLPHTAPEGAWQFVAGVRLAFNGRFPPPDCAVYVYPSSWIQGANGGPDRKPPRGKMPSPEESDTTAKRSSGIDVADPVRPVEELNSQFLCKIPFWKRAIDVVGAIVALILLMPLLLLVALLIKIVSPGPILFRQERVGYLGKVFTMWKFRTMHVNNEGKMHLKHVSHAIEKDAPIGKLDDLGDDRIIPFGKFLRKSAIDEIPQLFNVLTGDMSLVGPRPCMRYEADKFPQWGVRRFDTLPGMSGLWQVNGKNRTTFKEMLRLDISYAKKRAFLVDAKIFLKTIPTVVYQIADRKGHAHARSQFKGLSVREKIILRVGIMVILAFLVANMLHR